MRGLAVREESGKGGDDGYGHCAKRQRESEETVFVGAQESVLGGLNVSLRPE